MTQLPHKPFLIRVGGMFATLFGTLALASLPLSLLDIGTYQINGSVVSGPRFFLQAGPAVAAIGGLCLATGIGFLQNRGWARVTGLLFWTAAAVAFALLSLGSGGGLASLGVIGVLAVPFACAAWYFYRKPGTVAYYETLAGLEAQGESYSRLAGPSWLSRNFRWAIPTGLATVAATSIGFLSAFKSSDAYQTALSHAASDSAVVAALGTPLEDGFMPTGNITMSTDGGSAHLQFTLTGPGGSGRVTSRLQLAESRWEVLDMAFEPLSQ